MCYESIWPTGYIGMCAWRTRFSDVATSGCIRVMDFPFCSWVKESEFHRSLSEPKVLKDSYGWQTLLLQGNPCRNDDSNDENYDHDGAYGKVDCEDNGGWSLIIKIHDYNIGDIYFHDVSTLCVHVWLCRIDRGNYSNPFLPEIWKKHLVKCFVFFLSLPSNQILIMMGSKLWSWG